MNYQVIISDRANVDLKEIYDYLSVTANILSAERITAQIRKKAQDIGIFPYGYKESADMPSCRMVRAGRYLIFYMVDDRRKAVSVVRILHGKRNLRKEL